jgi:tetratricopeptide (TPR) repeat protein
MARVIEQETLRERSLAGVGIPEEMSAEEKPLAIKTWLERSQGFLHVNQFEEALHAAEQVFLLDPQNLEASRLVDEIQRKARALGKEESLFAASLYQEEIQRRIQRYRREAEAALEARRYSAARLAVEKLLLLDPKNREGETLLKKIEKAEQSR